MTLRLTVTSAFLLACFVLSTARVTYTAADTQPPERRIVRSAGEKLPPLPRPGSAAGSWPSFRGPLASGTADKQNLPDKWDVKTGENILWRTPIPGLAHSSPIVWGNRIFVTTAISSRKDATFKPGLDLVILQADTHKDSFILALNAATGETVWKTDRVELPSWGTPTVVATSAGPQLVANGSNFIKAYDPRAGKELWRLGGSSQITAPTPIAVGDFIIVASRARGPYMPTPLVYQDVLYVLGNNGQFDAYDLKTGEEVYRERVSASPVADDGKLYISGEDGEVTVLMAGPKLQHVATNSMGDLLMATPALSNGVMYVRTASSLFAIGRKP